MVGMVDDLFLLFALEKFQELVNINPEGATSVLEDSVFALLLGTTNT